MIEQEFVKYEQALQLKQLGFDELCLGYYLASTLFISNDIVYNSTDIPVIKAPLYQQAFRFFREKYNLRCQINYIGGLVDKTTWWDISVIGHYNIYPEEWEMKYQPYEKAELECLKKLIEIAHEK